MRLYYLMRFANLMANSSPNGKFCANQTTTYLLNVIRENMGGYVISDISIPTRDNKMIDISHIYLSEHGIFVVETKDIGGKLIGNDNDEHWVLTFPGDSNKYQVVNAVKQNKERVDALERILGVEDEFYNIVTFIKADIRQMVSDHIFYPFDMKKAIAGCDKDNMYTKEEIDEFYDTLLKIKNNPIMSISDTIDLIGNITIKKHHQRKDILKLS